MIKVKLHLEGRTVSKEFQTLPRVGELLTLKEAIHIFNAEGDQVYRFAFVVREILHAQETVHLKIEPLNAQEHLRLQMCR